MDFTMARAAGAYQYVVVTSASITLLLADTPRMFPFEISLNASNSPAGTLTFSWPITSTAAMGLPLDPVTDQALAESIGHFSAQVDQARNLLLGMLSHDMRNPLQTVQMTAQYLGQLNAGADVSNAARRLINSGAQLNGLLDDLVDFNRTNLGVGINIVPSRIDLAAICAEELEQLRAAYPRCRLQLDVVGNCVGSWDGTRVQQLLGNLVVNAIHHGDSDGLVRVQVVGSEADVRIEVSNSGPAIDAATLAQLFEPLKRGTGNERHPGLGLGLYIVREIAKGHGGIAQARSDEKETLFTVQLPRCK
jgi:signal transduction histidine kinase